MQKHYPQHRKHGMATARQGCATPVLMRAGGLSLAIAASACVAALAGCASERPQSTVSPGLDSGVTSSNGGGMRATGNVLTRIIHRTARNRPRPPNTWARDFIAKNFIKQPIRIVVNGIKGLALIAHFS